MIKKGHHSFEKKRKEISFTAGLLFPSENIGLSRLACSNAPQQRHVSLTQHVTKEPLNKDVAQKNTSVSTYYIQSYAIYDKAKQAYAVRCMD